MYDDKEFNDMGNDMGQYSQVNVMAAYVSTIKFALEQLELHLDELGDDILFENMSPFPDDVLGDDTLFAGYSDPWDPDEDTFAARAGCDCDDCRCRNADAKIKPERMSVGNIMDMLYKTRKAPQDYRMD